MSNIFPAALLPRAASVFIESSNIESRHLEFGHLTTAVMYHVQVGPVIWAIDSLSSLESALELADTDGVESDPSDFTQIRLSVPYAAIQSAVEEIDGIEETSLPPHTGDTIQELAQVVISRLPSLKKMEIFIMGDVPSPSEARIQRDIGDRFSEKLEGAIEEEWQKTVEAGRRVKVIVITPDEPRPRR